MRNILEFKIERNIMPLDYRRIFVSWIKLTLSTVQNGKYLEQFYKDTNQKPFTFSVVFTNPKFSRDSISFEGNTVKVIFSMMDEKMMGHIMTMAFMKMKNKDFKVSTDNTMRLTGINRIREELILQDRACFKTAPGALVLIREHDRITNKDKFYTMEDSSYEERVRENLMIQCKIAGFPDEDLEKIKVNSVEGKKVVAKNYGVYVDGVAGMFDISAPSYILQYLLTVGFCSKRSLGFGTMNLM